MSSPLKDADGEDSEEKGLRISRVSPLCDGLVSNLDRHPRDTRIEGFHKTFQKI